MKNSRWIDPYFKDSTGIIKPTIKDCWSCGQAGVYFIKNTRTGVIIYVGMSTTQLKKTIYRHFQQWTDRQKKNNKQFDRVTYPKMGSYKVLFIKCTAIQAQRLEKYYILKLEPADNPTKYKSLSETEIIVGKELEKQAAKAETLNKEQYIEQGATPF